MPGAPADLPPDIYGVFNDLFGQFFAGKFVANLSVDLALTDAEAASGLTRDVVIQRLRACGDCDGRGSKDAVTERKPCDACKAAGKREVTQGFFKVQTMCAACGGAGVTTVNPCGTCTGTGRVSTEATVSVVVPPNAEHGTDLTIEGEGSLGEDGAVGVLYVYLLVGGRPDPRAEAFAAHRAAIENLPAAKVHRPPMPTWQVALLGMIVLAIIGAVLLAR